MGMQGAGGGRYQHRGGGSHILDGGFGQGGGSRSRSRDVRPGRRLGSPPRNPTPLSVDSRARREPSACRRSTVGMQHSPPAPPPGMVRRPGHRAGFPGSRHSASVSPGPTAAEGFGGIPPSRFRTEETWAPHDAPPLQAQGYRTELRTVNGAFSDRGGAVGGPLHTTTSLSPSQRRMRHSPPRYNVSGSHGGVGGPRGSTVDRAGTGNNDGWRPRSDGRRVSYDENRWNWQSAAGNHSNGGYLGQGFVRRNSRDAGGAGRRRNSARGDDGSRFGGSGASRIREVDQKVDELGSQMQVYRQVMLDLSTRLWKISSLLSARRWDRPILADGIAEPSSGGVLGPSVLNTGNSVVDPEAEDTRQVLSEGPLDDAGVAVETFKSVVPKWWRGIALRDGPKDTAAAVALLFKVTGDSAKAWRQDLEAAMTTIAVPKSLKDTRAIWVNSSRRDGEYRTISDALSDAHEGSTILVREGLYIESLVINCAVKLIGVGTNVRLVSDRGNAVSIRARGVAIHNIHIRCETRELSLVHALTGGATSDGDATTEYPSIYDFSPTSAAGSGGPAIGAMGNHCIAVYSDLFHMEDCDLMTDGGHCLYCDPWLCAAKPESNLDEDMTGGVTGDTGVPAEDDSGDAGKLRVCLGDNQADAGEVEAVSSSAEHEIRVLDDTEQGQDLGADMNVCGRAQDADAEIGESGHIVDEEIDSKEMHNLENVAKTELKPDPEGVEEGEDNGSFGEDGEHAGLLSYETFDENGQSDDVVEVDPTVVSSSPMCASGVGGRSPSSRPSSQAGASSDFHELMERAPFSVARQDDSQHLGLVSCTNCRIHHASSCGIFITGRCRVVLNKLKLEACRMAGIELRDRANVTIIGSRIAACTKSGIFAHGASQLTVDSSDVIHCGMAGVEVSKQSTATLRECRVYQGLKGGLFVHDYARLVVRDSEIFANSMSNVDVRAHGKVEVTNCTVAESRTSGVYVSNRGEAFLRGNLITRNSGNGVELNAGRLTSVANRICDNKRCAVFANGECVGTIVANDLRNNSDQSISAHARGKLPREEFANLMDTGVRRSSTDGPKNIP